MGLLLFPENPIAIPNLKSLVESLSKSHKQAWISAHTGGPNTEDFIRILAVEAHAIDPRFGLNGKRGNPNDISDDVLCFKGEGADFLADGTPASVIDCIGGAGGPNPTPTWHVVSDPQNPIRTAWVLPSGGVGVPTPTVPTYESIGGDAFFRANVGVPLEADMALALQPLNSGSSVWFSRTTYDLMAAFFKGKPTPEEIASIIKKHRNEWRSILGLPPVS